MRAGLPLIALGGAGFLAVRRRVRRAAGLAIGLGIGLAIGLGVGLGSALGIALGSALGTALSGRAAVVFTVPVTAFASPAAAAAMVGFGFDRVGVDHDRKSTRLN